VVANRNWRLRAEPPAPGRLRTGAACRPALS
jgi:hypothetical protein